MIYNYTKCESVIAKIMADADLTDVRNRMTDIREWIFEAVEKIGAPMQYLDSEIVVEIEDSLIALPEDLHSIDAVAYSKHNNGPWVVMLPMTAQFKNAVDNTPNDPLMKEKITSQSLLYTINTTKYLDRMSVDLKLHKPEYFIKPGWLVTNRKCGFIRLAYKSVAVDERGYPLIPDSTSYQEAIYWYVTMKLMYPKLVKGKLGGKGVNTGFSLYNDARMQWNFYRNQAYAEAMMPTAGDMKNIKNEWNRLVPEFNADDEFFKNINKEEKFYNDYYYGY